MRQRIRKSKLEICKLVWKKRITAEKGISDKCAERIVQECIKLIERMLYGNVMIAFHKQDGTFCLERGTLVGYENSFIENSILQQNKSLLCIGVKNKKDGEDL